VAITEVMEVVGSRERRAWESLRRGQEWRGEEHSREFEKVKVREAVLGLGLFWLAHEQWKRTTARKNGESDTIVC
jgi:hypothetical protein